MQIFIHNVVPPGPLREDDAAMNQNAQDLAPDLFDISGLTFPGGPRIFIERVDGVDQGLVVLEDAFYFNKEFPTAAELDTLESSLKAALLTAGFSSVGVVRFHCLTAKIPAPPPQPPE